MYALDARPIDRIAHVLASSGAPGTFATRRTASTGDLHLDVTGAGPIRLPLSPATARRLCGIARPARYGLRDQTLLDRNVRDAWEIGKRQVKIDAPKWRRTLAPELERIARDLGVPEGCRLRAELHNLLVYGPGQFFGYEHDARAAWIASLPELCEPLREAGGDGAIDLAGRLARSQWSWLDGRIRPLCDSLPASAAVRSLVGLASALIGVLATAAIAGDRGLATMIVERLSPARGYPVRGAIAVLRSGLARDPATLGLDRLHADCTQTLNRLASAPARRPKDWSIDVRLRCTCGLCKRLARFLLASNEQQLDWPLANDRRAHVHQTITHHELPVTHVTRRAGSPYTLVLTKTSALFTREAVERKSWTSDLGWLAQTAPSFGAAQRTRRPAITARSAGAEARPRRGMRTRP